jgi:hypothetical protein
MPRDQGPVHGAKGIPGALCGTAADGRPGVTWRLES